MYSKFNEKTVQIQENANIMIMYCEYLKKKTLDHDLLFKMQFFDTCQKKVFFQNSRQFLLFYDNAMVVARNHKWV